MITCVYPWLNLLDVSDSGPRRNFFLFCTDDNQILASATIGRTTRFRIEIRRKEHRPMNRAIGGEIA
jgi:hypothetical protein